MFSCFSIFLSTLLFLCCAHQVHVMCKHLISALCKHLISALLHYLYRVYITFTAFTLPLQPFPLSLLVFRHACQTPLCQPQTSWLSHFLSLRSPQLERSLKTSGTLADTLFLQRQTLKMSLLEILQRSNTVLHTY